MSEWSGGEGLQPFWLCGPCSPCSVPWVEDAAGTDWESAAKPGAEAGVETSAADGGCVTDLEGADWAVANTTAARARQDQVSRAVTTIAYGLVFEPRTRRPSSSRVVDRARERCSSGSPPLLGHTPSHSRIAPLAVSSVVRSLPSFARTLPHVRDIAMTSRRDYLVLIEMAMPTSGRNEAFGDRKMVPL